MPNLFASFGRILRAGWNSREHLLILHRPFYQRPMYDVSSEILNVVSLRIFEQDRNFMKRETR